MNYFRQRIIIQILKIFFPITVNSTCFLGDGSILSKVKLLKDTLLLGEINYTGKN